MNVCLKIVIVATSKKGGQDVREVIAMTARAVRKADTVRVKSVLFTNPKTRTSLCQ